jgi:hypothetical protein
MSGIKLASKARWATVIAALFLATSMAPGDADAKRRRKKRRKKPAAAAKANVNEAALGDLMGPFEFGMTKKDVLKVLSRQLDERFQEKIKETTDVYVQDKLRRDKRNELKKVKKSFSEFTGQKTGWDVSIIDDQFAHKTGESMLVYWENNADGKDQRRFFFFKDGELYKMFIALNSSMLKGEQRSFAFFQQLMQAKYGDGKVIFRKSRDGSETPSAIDWQSRKYHVQAIDKLSFYGSFCLMIANPSIERELASARAANKKAPKKHSIIDSMLEGDEAHIPSLDSNKSAVEKSF